MALSADKVRKLRGRLQQAFKVAHGVQVYGGSYMALRVDGHATPTSVGYAAPYAAAPGNMPLGGTAHRKVLGDTSAPVVPEVEISIDGAIWYNYEVAGASGITDLLKPVYLTDDDTLTLEEPAYGLPVGVIVRHISGTRCDVYMFSFGELLAMMLGGGGARFNMYLGSFDLATVNPTAGSKTDLRTGIPMQFHGEIVDLYAMVDVAITVASSGDEFLLNLEIDGQDLTGGTLVLGAAPLGAKIGLSTAEAITGNNRFSKGSVLDVEITEAATGDDITAGRIDLWAVVRALPGT